MSAEIVPYSKQIPLNTQRKTKNYKKYFATVSYWWHAWLIQWNWHAQKNGRIFYAHYGAKKISMHRVIMGAYNHEIMIDHINHDGLDNRECNLRLVTNQLNQLNSLKQENCTSRYKGVSFYKNKKKFVARIINKKGSIFLGMFKDEISAAKAYDKYAKENYGEFANLNFPNS